MGDSSKKWRSIQASVALLLLILFETTILFPSIIVTIYNVSIISKIGIWVFAYKMIPIMMIYKTFFQSVFEADFPTKKHFSFWRTCFKAFQSFLLIFLIQTFFLFASKGQLAESYLVNMFFSVMYFFLAIFSGLFRTYVRFFQKKPQ